MVQQTETLFISSNMSTAIFINPNATKFTIQEFGVALKKRYRDEIDPQDIEGAYKDAQEKQQSLAEAVKELVDLYVRTDGHERHLILTAEELATRKTNSDKEGILKSIISAVSKPNGASVQDLKIAVRTQATLRKLQINTDAYGSDLVAALCEQNLVTYKPAEWQYGKLKTPECWYIFKAPRARSTAFEKLTTQQQLELCPSFDGYKQQENSGRPRYKEREQRDDYAA